MKSKHIIRNIALLLFTATGLFAQNSFARSGDDGQSVHVRDFQLVLESGQVLVDFTLEVGSRAAARGNTLSIIPVLTDGTISKELTPVVVRGRRARILYERRFIASPRTATMDESEMIVAGNGESLDYHVAVSYENWMAGSTLLLDGVDEGCCSAVRTNLGLIADNLMLPSAGPAVEEEIVIPGRPLTTGERLAEKFPFVKPAGSGETYSRDGVTVYFHQGRHNIDQNYRRNRQSLVDILSVVEEIRRSGDSEVESIVIAGFASPEGTTAHNLRLSERRAETVRKFIFDNSVIRPDRLRIHVGGEDWEGLREIVAASEMWDKGAVLDIIDNIPVEGYDGLPGREARLMELSGGAPYGYMYDNFFPELREAAYITVYFNNK